MIKNSSMKAFLSLVLLLIGTLPLFSQGASVAPTRVYYANNLGQTRTKTVTVLNKTKEPQSYQVSFLDFAVNNRLGKPTLQKANENPHSITPWISATPSYFTVKPGESMEIKVTLDTPNTPEAHKVKWGAMSIKLAKEQVGPLDDQQKQLGMAIVNTFQIIVYMFQSPPSITERNAEIYDFKSIDNAGKKTLVLSSENTSPSILDCRTYLEYSNLQTGWSHSTAKKRFTLLPGGAKEMKFEVPVNIPKGKYSVMGVVDYGSSNEIKAAEMEMTVE